MILSFPEDRFPHSVFVLDFSTDELFAHFRLVGFLNDAYTFNETFISGFHGHFAKLHNA